MRRVVTVLPVMRSNVFLQLRDKNIPTQPFVWGFFGGSIEKYESSIRCAKRETLEEIGIWPNALKLIHRGPIPRLRGIYAYTYVFMLRESDLKLLVLGEGIEIKGHSLRRHRDLISMRSTKAKTIRPAVDTPYFFKMIKKAHAYCIRGPKWNA